LSREKQVRNGMEGREKVVIQKRSGGMLWMLRRPPPMATGLTLAPPEGEAP
jgi:hypothetical protein